MSIAIQFSWSWVLTVHLYYSISSFCCPSVLAIFCSPSYLFSASTVFPSFRFYNQPCPTYATSLPPANYCVLLYNVKHILVAGRALLAGAAANHETPIPAGCPATESPRMDRPRTVRTTRTATVRTRWVSVFMPLIVYPQKSHKTHKT